jgi:UDP-N-acetylglucosamine 1-carboxyvinyltransferase
MTENESYQREIGEIIANKRVEKGWTQIELARQIGTSQPAINRIEKGRQNISLDMIAKFSEVLGAQILTINDGSSLSLRIHGGYELHGKARCKSSKNAAVALMIAALVNKGRTTLRGVSKIEEVFRITEVIESLGVKTRWVNGKKDLEIIPPNVLDIAKIDVEAARRTRSAMMLMAPLLYQHEAFDLPYAGGCRLGERTIEPHLLGLRHFGLKVDATTTSGVYHATVDKSKLVQVSQGSSVQKIVLIERGDTVTEHVLMAAALCPGTTIIKNASPNYMVQDVCFFLQDLGVEIGGIGTTTLVVRGRRSINVDVEYTPSEDPVEAMFFVTAALATHSEITIERVPIDFLEIELEILGTMRASFTLSDEYASGNGRTRLVDLTVHKSELVAPPDKIHPMPYPGLNIDNLPFFSLIAACAEGRTLIHDWVYENRAIYITNLSSLGAQVDLLDAHRVFVEGPTSWKPADITTPSALRPAAVLLLAMLAAPGTSILRNIYVINRGYEDLANRLNRLGAHVAPLTNI